MQLFGAAAVYSGYGLKWLIIASLVIVIPLLPIAYVLVSPHALPFSMVVYTAILPSSCSALVLPSFAWQNAARRETEFGPIGVPPSAAHWIRGVCSKPLRRRGALPPEMFAVIIMTPCRACGNTGPQGSRAQA